MTGIRAYVGRTLNAPVDAASLAAYRALFGLLMCFAAIRFIASGWIHRFYGEPSFFFKFWGFGWVKVAPEPVLYAIYGIMAAAALGVALGLFYRVSIAVFALGFAYTELLDVTNYLNHYYLVVLVSVLLCFMPLNRAYSLDAWRKPALRTAVMPAWALSLLRFQIGVVYVFAGLAKLNTDWLLYAQPLNIWLSARTEFPVLGPLFDELWVAYVFSWAGFLFDSTIVVWLLWRRTRLYAYAVAVGFHTMTGLLFHIGMFPLIMTTSALIFFAPDWPRTLFARLRSLARRRGTGDAPAPLAPSAAPVNAIPPGRISAAGAVVVAIYCLVQVAVPLRHYAYPGDVLWNEEGMRFAWKVMLREKHGSVTYYVRLPESGKVIQVPPRRYLNARQEREMSGQPDLILQLAHHIADDFYARGFGRVEVLAEARVSLNGRPARHMIDPERNLAAVKGGLAPKNWVLPAPATPPIQLRPYSGR